MTDSVFLWSADGISADMAHSNQVGICRRPAFQPGGDLVFRNYISDYQAPEKSDPQIDIFLLLPAFFTRSLKVVFPKIFISSSRRPA